MSAKLIFLCGKIAAGKPTLARDLALRENAVLLLQDEFLDCLFPGDITDVPRFVKYSSRLKNVFGHTFVRSCRKASRRRTRLSRQYEGAACRVPRAVRARACRARSALCTCVRCLGMSQLKKRSKNLPVGSP